MARVTIFCCLIISLLMLSSASAVTIVDTFNASDSHRAAGGSIVGSDVTPETGGVHEDVAFKFVFHDTDYYLDNLKLGITRASTASDILDILFLDSGVGGLPGNLLEAFEFNSIPFEASSEFMTTFVQTDSIAHPLLLRDHTYWLVASARGSMKAVWGVNSFAYANEWWSRFTETGPWTQQHPSPTDYATFRVSGTPVPEPSMASLAVAGLIGLPFLRRCRTRINGTRGQL